MGAAEVETKKRSMEDKGVFPKINDEEYLPFGVGLGTQFHDLDSLGCDVKHGKLKKGFDFSENNYGSFEIINESNETIKVEFDHHTEFENTSYSKGEEIYILGFSLDNEYTAMVVSSVGSYRMFDIIEEPIDKLKLMRSYLSLTNDKKRNIEEQLKCNRYERVKHETPKFTSLEELRLKYVMCRDTYSPGLQRTIENLLEECRGFGKKKELLKLKYILNINTSANFETTLTKRDIVQGLDKRLYKMDAVKSVLAETIIASKFSREYGTRILLVGKPGTGKSSIIRAISDVLGLPNSIIHLNGTNSALEIIGTDPSYDTADAGVLIKTFYQLGTTLAVLGLDEVDKMASGGNDGNPADALLDTLSDAHVCYDAFLEAEIDTRNTIYIATANSTHNIPNFLLNRFKIIKVDDYTDDDKVVIARDYILPELLQQYRINSQDIVFADEVLSYVVKNYCSDFGARMLKENLHSIIRAVICSWDEAGKHKVVVDKTLVDKHLEPITDSDSPEMRYHRNKSLFKKCVQDEIEKDFDILITPNLDSRRKETLKRKISYITAIIPEQGGFGAFDKDKFIKSVSTSHFGLAPVKERIAKSFYARSLKGENLSSERILLVGPSGVGKTSICESIAAGLRLPYIKIPLNGVCDSHYIKGFEPSYAGSDAGIIVKELAKIGGNKALIHLDEIDKLGKHDGVAVSNTLVDLLDDSSEFIDTFLGVPIDLSNVLFVATANTSNIEPWMLDRFEVFKLEGYTRSAKSEILDNYLLRRLEREYESKHIKLSIEDDAKYILLNDYCPSLGVRDLAISLQRVTEDLLYESARKKRICITKEDIVRSLGEKPIPRGNLPRRDASGIARALAVYDNTGLAFPIETVVVPDENTIITGLPKESTIDSVKLAKTFIRTHYPSECGDFHVHVHFGEGAVSKDGSSAGVAILLSMLSAVFDEPISRDVACTGEIDLFGNIFAVGGVLAKIQAAEQAGCKRVFIPKENYTRLRESDVESFSVEVIPVEHVDEVISMVLPNIVKSDRISNK